MKDLSKLPHLLLVRPDDAPSWVSFRAARASDLTALHEACFADRPLAQFGASFRRALEAQRNGRTLYLLATARDVPVATGQLVTYTNSVEIADLAVAPQHRRKGVGTALIKVLTRVAIYAGYDSVEISVMRGNEEARSLYERLGFVPEREFLMRNEASVIVLRKSLEEDVSRKSSGEGTVRGY